MSAARSATSALGLLLVLGAAACGQPAGEGQPRPGAAAGADADDSAVRSQTGEASGAVGVPGGSGLAATSRIGDLVTRPPESPSAVAPAPVRAGELAAWLRELPAPRVPGTESHGRTAEVLAARLAGWGLTLARQPFAWAGRPGVPFANLEVRLASDVAAAPLIVVGAHYDTVPGSPGADDNGSGVITLLGLARRLAARELSADVALVWFDEEESGFVGSREWWRALPAADRERLVGVINLETLGYTDRRPRSQSLPAGAELLLDPGDTGDFLLLLGNQDSADFGELVHLGLRAEQGPHMRVESYLRLAGKGWVMPDSRRSDHSTFWDAGVPAVMLTDTANFRNPHYHRASDRPDTLDYDFLAAVVAGVERAVLLLAEE